MRRGLRSSLATLELIVVRGRRGFLKFQCCFHWTLSASTCIYGFAGFVTIVRPLNEGCTFAKMFSAAFHLARTCNIGGHR